VSVGHIGGSHHPKKHSTSGLKKSAAGICVGMGSFSDPEELPGLAHFLEHMVKYTQNSFQYLRFNKHEY
jgi:nardilysin